MHDALTAEKTGITATAIMTERFTETAQVMAQVAGMPDYPFAVIAHPIANNTDSVLREKAEEAVRLCVGYLLES